jgi:opacity protein-like surface antigen
VHTPDESRPARRQGKPARRAVKTGLAVAGGLLLAAGMSASSAGAAVKPAATKAVLAATAAASAIPTCDAGINIPAPYNFEYYTDCTAGTYYYRTVAQCADGNLALGAEYLGSSKTVSTSDCEGDNYLNSADNWGLLYCSSNSGAGTYEGYLNESGDISQFLLTTGGGTIATGGTYMCDVDVNASNVIADAAPS